MHPRVNKGALNYLLCIYLTKPLVFSKSFALKEVYFKPIYFHMQLIFMSFMHKKENKNFNKNHCKKSVWPGNGSKTFVKIYQRKNVCHGQKWAITAPKICRFTICHKLDEQFSLRCESDIAFNVMSELSQPESKFAGTDVFHKSCLTGKATKTWLNKLTALVARSFPPW